MEEYNKNGGKKYKYLLKNIGVLTLSNFGSKILSFLLIPLYTNTLSTEEYGTYDVYSTTISLLIPILTLCILNAVMRFTMEKKYKESEVFTIGLKISLRSITLIILFVIINHIFNIIPLLKQFEIYFILLFVTTLLYDFMNQVAKGLENISDMAIAGVLNSIIMLTLNIIFLKVLKLELKGYFLANSIALIVPTIYLIIRMKIWKYVKINTLNKKLEKEMIEYGRPLIISTISWWIINISDRYIVTFICGLAANGIYAISYKLPSVLNVVQDIFNKVWSLSAVKEFNKDDENGFFKNVYNLYNLIMTLICSIAIIMSKFLAHILFANEFFEAWKYAPFLMIAVTFGALSGIFDGVFIAVKESKTIAKTTMLGAIVNIVLNIVLVYTIGVMGAAIATMISYFIIWLTKLNRLKKYINIDIKIVRDMSAYILLIVQATLLIYMQEGFMVYLIEIIIIFIIIMLFKTEVITYISKLMIQLKNKIKNK